MWWGELMLLWGIGVGWTTPAGKQSPPLLGSVRILTVGLEEWYISLIPPTIHPFPFFFLSPLPHPQL